MASKRAITSFFSPKGVACAPRAVSRASPLRLAAIRSQPQAVPRASLQTRVIPQIRLFSGSTARFNAPSNSSAKDQPQFKQWNFDDITSQITKPTSKPTIFIDVREPKELVSTGIIPSSLSIPLNSQPDALFLTPDEFLTRFGFSKPGIPQATSNGASTDAHAADADIVFYCRAGVRARAAAELAVQAGYDRSRIGVYDGSWLDWEKKGGKVEKLEGQGE
ncbi:rhodanese domain-containing protein [Coccidioides immitis RS]|uniref:Rhodanese domain-containing protein n=1 Tax=Coccidioides immitis (strain RS) TaxID=246410 RepID=J3KEP7_COCIM|nr:rhodanese domain-containing protein [Coccidioides immitis RS]EAS33979.3 rhodanese domain-containing protein [Coccidioides immitis RS]TPX21584.1 hypothetical protein DIZ76_015543 [Coccidioides immitis]